MNIGTQMFDTSFVPAEKKYRGLETDHPMPSGLMVGHPEPHVEDVAVPPFWTPFSACLDEEELFDAVADYTDGHRLKQARKFCDACIVQPQCLQHAMDMEGFELSGRNRYGLFGGMTPNERAELTEVDL